MIHGVIRDLKETRHKHKRFAERSRQKNLTRHIESNPAAQVIWPDKEDRVLPDERILEGLRKGARLWLEPEEEITAAAPSDINVAGRFSELWLALTDRRLLVLESLFHATGESEIEDPRALARELPLVLQDAIPLDQIASVERQEFVGIGAFVICLRTGSQSETRSDGSGADSDGNRRELVRFSRSSAHRFAEFEEKVRAALSRPEGSDEPAIPGKTDGRCEKCDRPYPTGTDFCPYCINRGAVLFRMLQYIEPYKGPAMLSLLLTIIVVVLQQTPPYLMKLFVDRVLAPPARAHFSMAFRTHWLWTLVWIYVARWVIGAVLGGGKSRLMAWLGQHIVFDLRTHLCTHVQSQSLSYFDKRHVGAVMSRIMNDTSAINTFLVDGLQNFMVNVLTPFAIAAIMVITDWKLALIALSTAPLIVLMTKWFTSRVRPVYRRYYAALSGMNGALATSIGGIRVVKSFAQESREIGRFTSIARDFYRANLQSNYYNVIYNPTLTLLTGISSVVIWAVGGLQVLHHQLSVGTILMFTGYMWQFFTPIQALCGLTDQFTNAATAGERIFGLLDTEPEVKDRPNAVSKPVLGQVEFDRVCFSYDTQDATGKVLQDVSFTAEPGQLIGLVGHSGSGKSTLVNLLLRFYDVTGGAIRIDGVDLRDLDSKTLREQVGIVLQEPFLFSGTIAENIAYGRPDAKPEEILEAARAANAHGFITRFADAYDTEVGERGVKLSGGEKQRISIARAILNNPRILILDEATSAVDTETEALIQEAMERLMKGRTTFAIAHRLSTLKNADRLVVMDHGRVAETGTHRELLDRENGIYAKLVRIQTEMAGDGVTSLS